jgi:uncharacterized membrane protein YjfL (UPF0719 family)
MNLSLIQTKAVAATKTIWKYLFWTIIAAVVKALLDNITKFNLPEIYVPVIGAILKGIATWVATQYKD